MEGITTLLFFMQFNLTMDDYAIILNALHYYKKVEKRGNFKQYNEERVNDLRDRMAHQMVWEQGEE